LITVEAIVAIEAEARAASQKRPSIDVLTAIIDDTPRHLLTSDGEGLAAWIVGKWPEYARIAGGSVEVAGASPEPQTITGYINPDGSGEGNWDE
jgi:hypothetical protein